MKLLIQKLKVDENTANITGIGISSLTYDRFFDIINEWLSKKDNRSHHIALINAYCAISALRDSRLLSIYNSADLVVPDGMPFVYWMRLILKKECKQFDATNIVEKAIEKSKRAGYTFYFYGGHPKVLENMIARLKKLYPYIKIVGYKSPPFRKLSNSENLLICDEINRLKPDILCIGLGTPKQDYWIDDNINLIKGTVMVPCGAVFDFFGGRVKRAPRWIQNAGMEWLYRLFSKDYERLLRRYTIMNFNFLINFMYQISGYKNFPVKRYRRDK